MFASAFGREAVIWGADVVTDADVVQLIKSAVCDWTKMLLFAWIKNEEN